MINILPAVIEITTRQESPQPSAVPSAHSMGWGWDGRGAILIHRQIACDGT